MSPPAKLRVVGKPFEKGTSGNPAGRPRGLARRTREIVGGDGDKIAQFWLDIMTNEAETTGDRLAASKLLAERGWGKPAGFQLSEDEDPLGLQEDIDALAGKFDAEIARLAAAANQGSLDRGDGTQG